MHTARVARAGDMPAWALTVFTMCMSAMCSSSCMYRGAAVAGDPSALDPADGWIVVREIPLVRQANEYDCGIAVAAALLRYWKIDEVVDLEQLRESLDVPRDQPVRAGTLKAALQARGFDTYLVVGRPEDLPRHLSRGRPLLVGMLKPYAGDRWIAHYEIVVAYHERHGVLTMDPGAGWRRYPHDGFGREWDGAGRLTLIAAPARMPSPARDRRPSSAR